MVIFNSYVKLPEGTCWYMSIIFHIRDLKKICLQAFLKRRPVKSPWFFIKGASIPQVHHLHRLKHTSAWAWTSPKLRYSYRYYVDLCRHSIKSIGTILIFQKPKKSSCHFKKHIFQLKYDIPANLLKSLRLYLFLVPIIFFADFPSWMISVSRFPPSSHLRKAKRSSEEFGTYADGDPLRLNCQEIRNIHL